MEPTLVRANTRLLQYERMRVIYVRVCETYHRLLSEEAEQRPDGKLSLNKHCLERLMKGRDDEIAAVLYQREPPVPDLVRT